MAVHLAQASSHEYTIFPVEKLVDNSTTDFDLFLNLERHFILYSGNGYRWQRQELTELLMAGHQHFFIRKIDLSKAEMYETVCQLPRLQKELPPRERIQHLDEVGAKFIQCLYEGDLTETCVEKAREIADGLVACVGEDPGCVKFLRALAEHDYYTYHHSIRVAAYAVAIAIGMGAKDQEALRQIALGGVFHDIGKKTVPLSLLNKGGPLTEGEWKQVKSHPLNGWTQVNQTILAHIPREIILHHHEKRNGTGYPHGLDRSSLLPEVQIATLADIFDALTSSRSYQQKRSRFEALDFIKHRLLKEEICPEAFRALVKTLSG